MFVIEALPSVSVVIPARHAAASLPLTLASIEAQDYPHIVDVVVAAADEATAAAASSVTVIPNPSGRTPVALNAAIARSSGDVIVRCDAHAVLPQGYVSRAVATLVRTGAANVGGLQVPVGRGFMGKAIAAAMSSRLGAGDARFRIGGDEGPVETVYLGVFRRSALMKTGGFDESFARNQDYELNHRIRRQGGVVWFDPGLAVEYSPRPSLRSLAKQYFQYGQGKRQFSRRHPGSLRWRQLVPTALVVVLGISLLASIWQPRLLVVPAGYMTTLVAGALVNAPRVGWPASALPAAWSVMHLSWGTGFLTGLTTSPEPNTDP